MKELSKTKKLNVLYIRKSAAENTQEKGASKRRWGETSIFIPMNDEILSADTGMCLEASPSWKP